MLNLTRYRGEQVELTDDNGLVIKVKVLQVESDGKVLIGFSAPKYINIVRSEIKRDYPLEDFDGNKDS